MRENIEVEIRQNPVLGEPVWDAVVRDGDHRAWSGSGDTANEAATKAVRKFLGDRNAREYVVE